MKTRQLGKSGLEVSALGLGCMGLSFIAEDLREIDAAGPQITGGGGRYSEAGQRMINR